MKLDIQLRLLKCGEDVFTENDRATINAIKRKLDNMSQELTNAVNELVAEVADSQGKLESITTFIQGLPEVVATAVRSALEEADAADDVIATQVSEARQALSDSVDSTLAAINANPAPADPAA